MERRAASHTEEEEMNQRRKLLNAARRGDTKAISKLFELYQVRVLSGDQLAKVNRTSTYMVPVKPTKGGKSAAKGSTKGAPPVPSKPAKAAAKSPKKARAKVPARKPAKVSAAKKCKAKHK
jgi:septal ring-binding cell division protein DamX